MIKKNSSQQVQGRTDEMQKYPVSSRKVEVEPRVMPKLLPFERGPTLSLGWGTSNPDRTGDRRPGWWKVSDLTGRVLPSLVTGLVLVAAGSTMAWTGLNLVPSQDSDWASYFVAGFGLILALAGIRIMINTWGEKTSRLPSTAEPGLWQRDYAWRETVRTENGAGHKEGLVHQIKTFVFLPVIAAILVMLHWPLFVAADDLRTVEVAGSSFQLGGTTVWMAAVVVIDLIVLAALGAMIYTLIQWLRFGRPRFRLLSLPARPGGCMKAELNFSRGVLASGDAEVSLHCLDVSGRAEAAADSKTPGAVVSLYSETRQLKTSGQRVRDLRIEFELPPDAPSTRIGDHPSITWRLILRIPTRGPDYRGQFLVPVYADSDP